MERQCNCVPGICVEGDECCESPECSSLESSREMFALGAAWALGDDEESPAALKARAEAAEAELARLKSAADKVGHQAACPVDPCDCWMLGLAPLLDDSSEHRCPACGCGVDGDGKCPCGCNDEEIDPLALALFGIRDHMRAHYGCADKRGIGGHHYDADDECALRDIVQRYGDARAAPTAGVGHPADRGPASEEPCPACGGSMRFCECMDDPFAPIPDGA